MENEGEKDQKEYIILDSKKNVEDTDLIFKLEYPNQKLDNNKEYIKWKQLMMKIYGNNAKEFRCIKDNILYYCNYETFLSNEFNRECPKCKTNICYFCLTRKVKKFSFYHSCCIKKSIYRYIYCHGPRFLKNDDKDLYNVCFIILAFLPGISLFIIINKLAVALYLEIEIKKLLCDEKRDSYDSYDIIFEKYNFICLPYLFFIIMISIIFFIYNIYFIIILLLISIPFKCYPIKFIYCVIFSY